MDIMPRTVPFTFSRLAVLTLIPLVGIATPLLAIPAIALNSGAGGWVAIAVGQGVGLAASVIVELGWTLSGPQRVAGVEDLERRGLFELATISKAILFALTAPIAGFAAYVFVDEYSIAAALSAVAATAIGLTASWFFVGTGHVLSIVLTESIPRLLAVVLSSVALVLGAPLVWNPIALLSASVVSPILAWTVIVRRHPARHVKRSFDDFFGTVRDQWIAVSARAFSSLYTALPIPLMAIAAPEFVASFAAAERLQRMTLTVLASLPNSMQGWVGADRRDRPRRVKAAVAANVLLGLAAGAVFAIFAPFVVSLLFAGTVYVSPPIVLACGGVILLTCASRATGTLGLVAYSRIGTITLSAGAGATVGVVSILLLGSQLGAVGGMSAEILAELVVLAVQAIALGRILAKPGEQAERRNQLIHGSPKYSSAEGISIIVLAWQDSEMTAACLRSLPPESQKILVDNGSAEPFASELRQLAASHSAILVRSEQNLGFARGMNAGLDRADRDIVIFSNNDIEVDAGAVEGLAAALGDPLSGAAFPRTRNSQGSISTAGGNFLTLGRAFAHAIGFSVLRIPALRLVATPGAGDWLSGPFVAMRRDLAIAIGGLPEASFFYAEDYRLCWVLRQRGYSLAYVEEALITHVDDASAASVWKPDEIARRQTLELTRAARDQYRSRLARSLLTTWFTFGCWWRAKISPTHIRLAVLSGAREGSRA